MEPSKIGDLIILVLGLCGIPMLFFVVKDVLKGVSND